MNTEIVELLESNISLIISLLALIVSVISLYFSHTKNNFDKLVALSSKNSELNMIIFEVQSSERRLFSNIESIDEENREAFEIIKKKASFIKLDNENQLRSGEKDNMLVVDEKINSAKKVLSLWQELEQEYKIKYNKAFNSPSAGTAKNAAL